MDSPKRTITLTLISSTISAAAIACTCFSPAVKTMRELAEWQSTRAEAVFEGKVEKTETMSSSIPWIPGRAASMTFAGAHRIVTLRVSRVYRGPQQKALVILTGLGGGDCGVNFETGVSYLVYANRGRGEQFFTDICMGTDVAEHHGPALHFLRGEPPGADDLLDPETYMSRMLPLWTSVVCGRVTATDGKALVHGVVHLWKVGQEPLNSAFGVIASDGSFCTEPVFAGKYWVGAEAGEYCGKSRSGWEGYYPDAAFLTGAAPVGVQEGVKTSGIDFTLRERTRATISGRVAAVDGTRLPSDGLEVRLVNLDRNPLSKPEIKGVGPDGSFAFYCATPGRFRLTLGGPASWRWSTVQQEVELDGQDKEVVFRLARAK